MLEKVLDNKYIVLYSDEFKNDIWVRYMEILNLPHNTQEVKLEISKIIPSKNEEEK